MKKKVASVVVVNNENKILILKRGKDSSYPGTWNFPGGGVEKNEENRVAAVRELVEETGLSCFTKDLNYLCTLENDFLIIRFYLTSEFEGNVSINKESEKFLWINPEDLTKFNFVGTGKINQDLFDKIINEV